MKSVQYSSLNKKAFMGNYLRSGLYNSDLVDQATVVFDSITSGCLLYDRRAIRYERSGQLDKVFQRQNLLDVSSQPLGGM